MGDKSKIEWTDATWNILVGCSRVSPGCDHCYAIGVAHRGMSPQHRGLTIHPEGERVDWNGQINEVPHLLDQPLRWRRPRRIFVNSLSDLFHPDVDEGFIGSVWNTMALSPQHTFQILTKRPQRMAEVLNRWADDGWSWRRKDLGWCGPLPGPLPNVWLGTSIESSRYAFRADHLRATPAAVRFVSAEPLLDDLAPALNLGGIDWLIVGGESGPGSRPMHPSWARNLRDAAVSAGVPLMFKQWGEWAPVGQSRADGVCEPFGYDPPTAEGMRRIGKKAAGRVLDGRTWDQYPLVAPCPNDTNGDSDCGLRRCPHCGPER